MKVRLEVQGLSVFLPKPFQDPTQLRILIPDVRDPVTREANGKTFHVCAHTPKLLFPGTNEEWPLHGEHISLSGGAGKIQLHQDFLEKMALLERIAPGAGKLDRLYLADPPTPPGPECVNVVADMQLEHGEVSIGDWTPEMSMRTSPESAPAAETEMVAYVTIEIDVPENQLTIMTKKFGTREVTRNKLITGREGETVEVILSNACDREEDPTRPDGDFIIYYDFSHDYQGPKLIPHPIPPGSSSGFNASATTPGSCIAGLFSESA
jgi:hypothetical protein